MRENAVRELTLSDFLLVTHILGERNLADLFTKEDKDVHHYQQIRNAIMAYPPVRNSVHTSCYITGFFDALCSTPETARATKGGVRDNSHSARRIVLNYPDDPATSLVWRHEPLHLVEIDN